MPEKRTTKKTDTTWLLEWLDDEGNVFDSMEIGIEGGDGSATIEANYRMMKRNHPEQFIEELPEINPEMEVITNDAV